MLILFVGLALGIFWRVQDVPRVFLFGDEYHSLAVTTEPYSRILTTFDDKGSHVVLPLLQKAAVDLVGPGLWSYRLPALLPGILTLFVFYYFAGRMIGKTPATIAALALAVSPIHIFYSHFGRSYCLLVLLCFLLVASARWLARTRGRIPGIVTALLVGAIPYVHLSGIGLVVGTGLACCIVMWRRRRSPRDILHPILVFGVGVLLAIALFFPILGQLYHYLTRMPEEAMARPFGFIGIVDLLAGGRIPAFVWLGAVPLASGLLWWKRHDSAPWLTAAFIGPLLALTLTRPHGMEYAHARYLLPALPFILIMLSYMLHQGAAMLVRGAAVERLTLGAGLVLITAVFLTGPASPLLAKDGPYANTYIGMKRLPAFDREFPFTPEFYHTLAGEPEGVRIIEAPARRYRPILLYRNYYLCHGKPTSMCLMDETDIISFSPYLLLDDIRPGRSVDGDYLILHMDILREVYDYWQFVYNDAWPSTGGRGLGGYMGRHERKAPIQKNSAPAMWAEAAAARLTERYGPPVFRDRYIQAWDLRPVPVSP